MQKIYSVSGAPFCVQMKMLPLCPETGLFSSRLLEFSDGFHKFR